MIHVIDEKTDEILAVLTEEDFWDENGQLGYEEDLKGKETYAFAMPANHVKVDFLTTRRKVVIPGEDPGEFKEFILTDPLLINNVKEFYLLPSFTDLRKQKIIDPVILDGQTPSTAASFVLDGTRWELGIVEYTGIRKIEFEDPLDAYDAIWKVAKAFDLEIRFRVEVDGDKVVRRLVDLIIRRGELSGKEVVFGKDIEGLERREQAGELVTALKCYGPIREDDTRLTVEVRDDDALQRWGDKGRHLWGMYEPESDDQDMTLERLTSLGETELAKRTKSNINYVLKTIALEHIYGLEHEKVRLGDTNFVKDEDKNPPIYLEARVIAIKRSIKNRSRKTVEYGDFIEYTKEQVQGEWKAIQADYLKKIEQAKQFTRDYAEKKRIRSETIPSDNTVIWIKPDNEKQVDIAHVHDGVDWVPLTTTDASDIDTGVFKVGDGITGPKFQTAKTGARIEFDSVNGFLVYDQDNNILVQFPINVALPNKFKGDIDASTISGSQFISESEYGKITIVGGGVYGEDKDFITTIFRPDWIGVQRSLDGSNVDNHVYLYHDKLLLLNAVIESYNTLTFKAPSVKIPQTPAQGLALINGWSNMGGIYPNLVYYIDSFGWVYIKGSVKGGLVGLAANNAITRLPADIRPSQYLKFRSAEGHIIHVSTTGDIMVESGSNAIVSLNGIRFNI